MEDSLKKKILRMSKEYKMESKMAIEKAIRYYRRWTLGLIPVTIFMPEKIITRSLKYEGVQK